jgi:hypothetical protein
MMTKPESHIAEKKRIFHGEDIALPLVNWLNYTTELESRERILRVWHAYRRLCLYAESMFRPMEHKRGKVPKKEQLQMERRYELNEELNQLLSFYTLVPRIDIFQPISLSMETMLTISYDPAPASALRAEMDARIDLYLKSGWPGIDGVTGTGMGEPGAIRVLLDLIGRGLIWRLNFCDCGTYFFQRFKSQKHCSDKCRLAKFRKSDGARLKHNEYQRNLYHLHKSGTVK